MQTPEGFPRAFDIPAHLCYNNHMGIALCGKAVQSFPRKGVSRMSVMEVISLLILITNIVALVVTICNIDKK